MKGIIKKLLSMPKSRIVIALMCILFVAGFVMNSCSSKDQLDHSSSPNSSIDNAALDLHENNAISVGEYQQKLKTYNTDQYNQAAMTGKSYFQHPDGHVNGVNEGLAKPLTQNLQQQKPLNAVAKSNAQPEPAMKASVKNSAQKQKIAKNDNQALELAQTSQEDLAEVYGHPLDNQQAEQTYQKDVQAVVSGWANKLQMVITQSPKDNSNSMGNGAGDSLVKASLVKAGYIGFAVIDTSVNSDQIGTPVLAHIVEGPLKGSKLLGGFTREGDYIVVKFNLMSMPTRNKSISISAYAVDGTTAQIALASDVNHHYIERYGSLFAAAFLQGFGTYFSNQNQNQQICLSGQSGGLLPCFNVNNNNQPSVKSAAFSGLGQVGTALSSNMASVFNRPPTVKLYQGTGVGILFTNDVNA